LIPCISQATTLSTPFEDDLSCYARGGFGAVELWLTKLETYLAGRSIADVKALLTGENMKAVAAAGQGGLLLSVGAEREAHWSHFKKRLEWLQELEIPTLILSPDFVSTPTHDDYKRGASSLTEAAALAKSAGVKLALEFQKGSGYCSCLETAVALIASSGAENLGVCLDLFHYYTGPSKFEDLAYLTADNLAWVQLSDLSGTPREIAGDSDRILPGEGDFQIEPILEHLRTIGYNGFLSVEVLNPSLWEIAADRVADAAYGAVSRTLGQWKPNQGWGAN
jgi:sugar phosphate isomerase/epimerase